MTGEAMSLLARRQLGGPRFSRWAKLAAGFGVLQLSESTNGDHLDILGVVEGGAQPPVLPVAADSPEEGILGRLTIAVLNEDDDRLADDDGLEELILRWTGLAL